jgi:hypothetical protein
VEVIVGVTVIRIKPFLPNCRLRSGIPGLECAPIISPAFECSLCRHIAGRPEYQALACTTPCCERVEQRKKYPDAACEAELASIRHFWLRTRMKGCLPVPTDLVGLSAQKLGIQVIWCDSYAEVQNCLNELKHNGAAPNFGRKWSDEIGRPGKQGIGIGVPSRDPRMPNAPES